MVREMMLIGHTVTGEDGNLKFIRLEEFTDSQFYANFFKTVEEAKANRQNEPSVAA